MNPAVEAARRAAAEKAARQATPAAEAETVEVTEGVATPIPTAAAPAPAPLATLPVAAPRLTMAHLNTGRLANDGFMKMKHEGFLIGEGCKQFIEEFDAVIDITIGKGYVPMFTIKFGNPVQYESTTDGATTRKGQSWQAILDRARMLDPNATPYPTAEISCTLLEKTGTMDAGDRVGMSLSTTNYNEWESFFNDMVAQGYENQKLKVKVKHKPRSNSKGSWGIATFELISPA